MFDIFQETGEAGYWRQLSHPPTTMQICEFKVACCSVPCADRRSGSCCPSSRRANSSKSQAHGTNSLSSVSNSGSGIACTSTEPLYFPAYTCLRAAPLAVLPPPSTFLTICVRTSRADLADLVLVSERAAQSACRCFIPMNT